MNMQMCQQFFLRTQGSRTFYAFTFNLKLSLPLQSQWLPRLDLQLIVTPANHRATISEYDGGDCCECDCVDTFEYPCGYYNNFNCLDPTSTCFSGYVEAGTKTTVTTSANAYDTRPGEDSDDVGCGEDGCAPALARDGISVDIESRWSCAQKIVPDGALCKIEFTFESPQDIVEVEVAFAYGELRSRSLEVSCVKGVSAAWHAQAGP